MTHGKPGMYVVHLLVPYTQNIYVILLFIWVQNALLILILFYLNAITFVKKYTKLFNYTKIHTRYTKYCLTLGFPQFGLRETGISNKVGSKMTPQEKSIFPRKINKSRQIF